MNERERLEKAIIMMCEGRKLKDIYKEVEWTAGILDQRLNPLRRLNVIPYEKSSFPFLRKQIMVNFKKWQEYEEKKRQMFLELYTFCQHNIYPPDSDQN